MGWTKSMEGWSRNGCRACVGCVYYVGAVFSTCDYYLMTGKRRPCSAEEARAGRCTVKTRGTVKREWGGDSTLYRLELEDDAQREKSYDK